MRSAMKPEPGTSDNTEYVLFTPQRLLTGSKKELLAILKKVDLSDFAPQHVPELRSALLNVALSSRRK